MKFPKILLAAAALAAPLLAGAPAFADGGIYVGVEGETIAVSGYDTVSYFRGDGVPVKGDARFAVEYQGAQWHFASQENADAFRADPAAFAPQYGGHCSWAMGRGYLAPGDPTAYDIVDGKLYLNFNQEVRSMWHKDIAGFIGTGDVNWSQLPDGKRFG